MCSSALPSPNVSISPTDESLTLCQSYSLNCSVSTVLYLAVVPEITWNTSRTQVANGTGFSLLLNFDSLTFSEIANYTCTAIITIHNNVTVTGEAFINIEVPGQLM